MIVRINPSAVLRTRWYEYLIRFVLGGAMTAAAGFIALQYGPIIGGLFLAFPAIFPASVTLVEKHTRQRKEKAGMVWCPAGQGSRRSRCCRRGARKLGAGRVCSRHLAADRELYPRRSCSGDRRLARGFGARVAGAAMAVNGREYCHG